MNLTRIHCLLAFAVIARAEAQSPIVVPNGLANTEGIAVTAWPWGLGATQKRVQYIFDTTHFTNQGINYPIVIYQLRWRANGGATGVAGSYNLVTVQLGTCPTDQAAASTTFATNLGTNATTVYAGQVNQLAGAGLQPNNWYVDITLSTPFVYDPAGGDLTFDVATDGAGWVGGVGASQDCGTTGVMASRVYNLTSSSSPTGTFQLNVGTVTEINFVATAGAATVASYGAGCNLPTPLQLAASPRPVIGNTVTLATSNVPASSQLGASILSFTQFQAGLDLTPLGMPGCRQYVGADVSLAFLPAGGTGTAPLAIPNNQAFSGMHVFAQSAAFAAGQNPLGVVTSNGLDLGLGLQ